MTTILAAVGTGILVLLVGSLPWTGFGRISGLSAWNLRAGLLVPWAIVPMTLYLWAYFGLLGGQWGAAGAERRRANLRANRLPGIVWRVALPAGLLGFGAIVALLAVIARLVRLPVGAPISTPAGMPVATMFALLVMQSVVAGVTEESAFRGYMQSIISREFGVTVAIVASGALFGLLHFPNHPGDVLLMLPYYIAVSAMYGALTWAADSIWPALVLHSAGDVVVLTRWWLTGRPEWQLSATPPPLVWDSGIDASFAVTVLVAILLAILTAWSYRLVRDRRLRSSPAAAEQGA
jgi:membrane protease YdiL (CAAX protease family)